MDIRQPILLLIAIAVPLALFRLRRPDWVVAWIAVTLSIHVFDTSTLTYLPAARIVGLIYLPQAILRLPFWIRFKPVSAWLLNFGYLLILGVIFGFLLPWPASDSRALTTTAPGRAIIYPIRLISDLSLMIFLAGQLCKPGMLLFFGRVFLSGAAWTAAMGAINLLLPGWDPYNYITGLEDLREIKFDRARGLSYEPRGLGLSCVYALMVLLVYPGPVTLRRKAMMVINLLGLLAAFSTSALAVVGVGLVTIWSFLTRRMRLTVLGAAIVIPTLVIVVAVVAPTQFQHGLEGIQSRTSTERLRGAVATSLLEEIAWRFDVFDSSALLFLGTHPQYIVTGTGPGEIMLAASSSLPPGIFTLIFGQSGLDGVPTLGLLLETCNSGLVGAVLWIAQVFYCWRALKLLSGKSSPADNRDEWRFGQALFVIGVAFYLVQTPLEQAYWPVLLSIGWAAVSTVAEHGRASSPILSEDLSEAQPQSA